MIGARLRDPITSAGWVEPGTALDWHPVLGDRGNQLAITGTGVDPDGMAALLDSCLVTPGELAAPGTAATLAPDPFADLLGESSR